MEFKHTRQKDRILCFKKLMRPRFESQSPNSNRQKGNEAMRKITAGRKWISLLLLGAVLLSGCKGTPEAGTDGANGVSKEDGDAAMGRYMEQKTELPESLLENITEVSRLRTLEDGSLGLLEEAVGLYVSKDGGETWEQDREYLELQEIARQEYVADLALAPDKSVAVIHVVYDEADPGIYEYRYDYIAADGTKTEIPYQEKTDELRRLCFGKDNRLYGISIGGKVYELDCQNGTASQLFEIQGVADTVCFTENYMVIFASRGVTVYNLTEGALKDSDEVLDDFAKSYITERMADMSSRSVVCAPGEKDVLYLALREGIYRHTVGGAAMEQVADGSLNTLGNPQSQLWAMEALSDGSFLVLCQEGLFRYAYDPSVSAVPEEQLSIYSLYEDYTIRQAVSLYQNEHPEVYVRYETGMQGDDGMTEEDAIKNLNTKLAAGQGPDLLVLDGLPAGSYEEKGLLADLTELHAGLTGENSLYENLVDACRNADGTLYSLPVRFGLPLLVGDKDSLDAGVDLKTLADTVEALRIKQPSGEITAWLTEEEVLKGLSLSSKAAWTDESGRIDEAALKEFLTEAKRIYQAELKGYTQEELSALKETKEQETAEGTAAAEETALASSAALGIAMDSRKLGSGYVKSLEADFNLLATLADDQEGVDYASMPGQRQNSFVPYTRVGILSASSENARAKELFTFLFGPGLQDLDLPDGLPMNQASMEKLLAQTEESEEEGGMSIAASVITDDGMDDGYFSVEIRNASEEHRERLKELIAGVETLSGQETAIESAVYEIGPKALNGSASVEEAVSEIVRKAALYLAE